MDVLAVPVDKAETEEMVEEMDSVESLLLSCSEGRRGGRAGDLEGLLVGILGGPAGFASCEGV